MSDNAYPRIITIPVPANVKPEFIGEYVSEKAHKALIEAGFSAVIPHSSRIVTINERLYALEFKTRNQVSIPATVDIYLAPLKTEAVEQAKTECCAAKAVETKGPVSVRIESRPSSKL